MINLYWTSNRIIFASLFTNNCVIVLNVQLQYKQHHQIILDSIVWMNENRWKSSYCLGLIVGYLSNHNWQMQTLLICTSRQCATLHATGFIYSSDWAIAQMMWCENVISNQIEKLILANIGKWIVVGTSRESLYICQ